MHKPNVKTPLPARAWGAKRNSFNGNRTTHGAGRSAHRRQAIDARYAHYETLKATFTAKARTPAEHDAAVKRAAQIAGV